ncbi:MAG: hypothetical protein HY042_11325 [Spirochaetia bacterium]|nr:hypothetical protein [Spirochaetia bacterium]
MDQEQIREYKRVLVNLAHVLIAEHIPHLVQMIEKIPDDAVEVRRQFQGGAVPDVVPAHWITALRIPKFALVLKQNLLANYDSFMNAYQVLSSKATRSKDESQLLEEIGKLLYDIDETTGEIERSIPKLLDAMRTSMTDHHNVPLDPGEDFYRSAIDEKAAAKLKPHLIEVYTTCHRMLELERLMLALVRLKGLILGT